MNKALFLDRDGTLIYDRNYLSTPDEVELIPGVSEGLSIALQMKCRLFLFTNQSGVGRNYFSMDDVNRIHERMEQLIGLRIPLFDDVCIAVETPDDPQVYRKPSPKFILEMIGKHHLDPTQCYMVGDTQSDILSAVNAGITPIAVMTGKGDDPHIFPEVARHNVRVFPDLRAFTSQL
ncbi:MAG: HAD-IIIA family hydrolase [Lentisphaerales bacterium]|jgi:D-glycero-D-manno-heptose 1,7-bisphosphate phosphatase|nr:MAG: HAD-IIIA family hydrolase [Lentisphaerales bacterium]